MNLVFQELYRYDICFIFSRAQQYYYYFTFDGELNLFKQLFGFGHLKGACHADEVSYLFA